MDSPIRVRDVRSSRGPAWLAGGWSLFRAAPSGWIGLSAGWLLISLATMYLPMIVGVFVQLIQPIFFASFAIAARRQGEGQMPQMGDLFAGFRRPLRPLLNLGALLAIANLAILLLMVMLGLPVPGGETGDITTVEYAKELQENLWIIVVGVALTTVVKGALWFAPALLAFHDLKTAHAIRWSLYACLSNVGAMLAYGIALTVVFVAGALPWGLGLLVVIPVMVASTYTGYADVFEETGEAKPEESTPA